MFHHGLKKIATAVVTMTPEEFYEHKGSADKYVGALAGNIAGMTAGLKGKAGQKAKTALIGAALGTAGGGVAGHELGKAIRKYQAAKIHRLAGELKLRATPSRRGYAPSEGESE